MTEFDILNEIAGLPSEKYLPKERYHDFRKIFLGSNEGKRVLREIVSWGRLLKQPIIGNPIDPYSMAIQLGERNIALRLLATLFNEPPEPPTRAKKHHEVKNG